MPALDDIVEVELTSLSQNNLQRQLHVSERCEGIFVIRNNKKLISFSCNDYFGLSSHPKIIEASIQATQRYGAGAGASRFITGNHPLYNELERQLARQKSTEASCVFGSGYLTNIGTISALVGVGDLVIADKYVHASILDGIKLSGADCIRFKHNNLKHLKELLDKKRKKYKQCLIITETIFSMDGDCAPVSEIHSMSKDYNSWLMTDDAHGLAIIKENNKEADIQMGTLSKAVGSYGGYVCGSNKVINYIKSVARSAIYTTALPAGVIGAAIAGLRIIEDDLTRCKKSIDNAKYFSNELGLPEPQSAIVPIVLGEEQKTMQASTILEDNGFLVSAIRPPTVPKNTSRLRFTFSSLHQKKDISRLTNCIKQQDWI